MLNLARPTTETFEKIRERTDSRFFSNESRTINQNLALTMLSVATATGLGAYALASQQFGSSSAGTLASTIALLGIMVQNLLSCTGNATRVLISADGMSRLAALDKIGTLRHDPKKNYVRIKGAQIQLSLKVPTITLDEGEELNFHQSLAGHPIVHINGAEDSGKSRVLRSFALQNEKNPLRINNYPVTDIHPDDFDRAIAYLPQNRPPINGISIRSILFGNNAEQPDHVIIDKITKVARYIDISFLFSDSQPDINKINAVAGSEFGEIRLSESIRDRLLIASLLLREPLILLLDDPFSALANPNRIKLENGLKRWVAERRNKIFIVSHHIETSATEPVLLVNEGDICVASTHQSLLRYFPPYADLFPDESR